MKINNKYYHYIEEYVRSVHVESCIDDRNYIEMGDCIYAIITNRDESLIVILQIKLESQQHPHVINCILSRKLECKPTAICPIKGCYDSYKYCIGVASIDGRVSVYGSTGIESSTRCLSTKEPSKGRPNSIIQQPIEMLHRFVNDLIYIWVSYDDETIKLLQCKLDLTPLSSNNQTAKFNSLFNISYDCHLLGTFHRFELLNSRFGYASCLVLYFGKADATSIASIDVTYALHQAEKVSIFINCSILPFIYNGCSFTIH